MASALPFELCSVLIAATTTTQSLRRQKLPTPFFPSHIQNLRPAALLEYVFKTQLICDTLGNCIIQPGGSVVDYFGRPESTEDMMRRVAADLKNGVLIIASSAAMKDAVVALLQGKMAEI